MKLAQHAAAGLPSTVNAEVAQQLALVKRSLKYGGTAPFGQGTQ